MKTTMKILIEEEMTWEEVIIYLESKLLPCPFCGGTAKFMEDSRWIICKDCNVSIIGKEYTLQSSAETWNKRYKIIF